VAQGGKLLTTRRLPEPDGWREIPQEFQGKIEPNYYCRGWNAKREKYCGAKAGTGTDHPGTGRCNHHGGNSPATHGAHRVRYAGIQHKRIGELYEERQGDEDPLNLIPEVNLLRSIVHDFVERNDAFQEMLLAWHESWATGKQPSPGQYRAFVRVIEEYEDIIRAREAEKDSPEMLDLEMARMYVRALEELEHNPKPRKILDITTASKLLVDISAIVARIEKSRSENAMSRPEFYRIMERMGVAVAKHNGIADPDQRLEAIKQEWQNIMLRVPK
jgi:hypothetical protein